MHLFQRSYDHKRDTSDGHCKISICNPDTVITGASLHLQQMTIGLEWCRLSRRHSAHICCWWQQQLWASLPKPGQIFLHCRPAIKLRMLWQNTSWLPDWSCCIAASALKRQKQMLHSTCWSALQSEEETLSQNSAADLTLSCQRYTSLPEHQGKLHGVINAKLLELRSAASANSLFIPLASCVCICLLASWMQSQRDLENAISTSLELPRRVGSSISRELKFFCWTT